jgi:hypothetical protein
MIVVNFSTQHYLNGQKRLSKSINGHKQLMLNSYEAISSPTHSESPYEFKIHAIEKAFQFDDVVLYCDASMYAIGDLTKIENIIKEDGFFGQEAGHWVGDWTNDFTRDYFKLTEEEAKVPGGMCMFSAGLLGLNIKNIKANDFFTQWKASAKAGCFKGDWKDHRHDMTCASIIAQRMGFKFQRGGSLMAYLGPGYSRPEPGVVVLCQGML